MEKRLITRAESEEKGYYELERGSLVWFVSKDLGDCPITMLHGYVKGAKVGQKGAGPQWHDFDEISHMLKGEMTEFIDGEPYPLKPGDTVLIPAGAKHYTLTTTDGEVEFIIAFTTPKYVIHVEEEDGSVTTLTLQEILAQNR